MARPGQVGGIRGGTQRVRCQALTTAPAHAPRYGGPEPCRHDLVREALDPSTERPYASRMTDFQLPDGLLFNRGPIADPAAYAEDVECASWLCLTGQEFAAMDGGMSFDAVREAVPVAANVISDPPRTLDLDLARRHVEALDELPRPTLVSCRAGPRASAVVYMYAGLKAGASPDDVVAAVERDRAPCASMDEYKIWIADSIRSLSTESPSA